MENQNTKKKPSELKVIATPEELPLQPMATPQSPKSPQPESQKQTQQESQQEQPTHTAARGRK